MLESNDDVIRWSRRIWYRRRWAFRGKEHIFLLFIPRVVRWMTELWKWFIFSKICANRSDSKHHYGKTFNIFHQHQDRTITAAATSKCAPKIERTHNCVMKRFHHPFVSLLLYFLMNFSQIYLFNNLSRSLSEWSMSFFYIYILTWAWARNSKPTAINNEQWRRWRAAAAKYDWFSDIVYVGNDTAISTIFTPVNCKPPGETERKTSGTTSAAM